MEEGKIGRHPSFPFSIYPSIQKPIAIRLKTEADGNG